MATYVSLDSIQRPSGGAKGLSTWGDQVNDNCAYLYQREQFQVYLATAVSIPNITQTTLAYDTVIVDNLSGWSAVTHQYTIPGTGTQMWMFSAVMQWAANGTGTRSLLITTAGGLQAWNFLSAATDSAGRMSCSTLTTISGGSTAFVQVVQSSGAALNTGSGIGLVKFSGMRVG